jgi:hypothetical protein
MNGASKLMYLMTTAWYETAEMIYWRYDHNSWSNLNHWVVLAVSVMANSYRKVIKM